MIAHKENLDYVKHLEFALGEYMQALNELNKKNSNVLRVFDFYFYVLMLQNKAGMNHCIYLQTIQLFEEKFGVFQ